MDDSDKLEKAEKTIAKLRQNVGSNTVLVAVSGGVDSATTATLLARAGIRTRCIFIDTGFMRKNEPKEALELLKQNSIHAELIDAREQFFTALTHIDDSREKRLVFKKTYFQVIEKYLQGNGITFLAQGSQSKSDLLKRGYHNVCNNEYINTYIHKIEPLLGLSKTEIRLMARTLNLTEDLAERIPFPGPGLLIRFGGKYTPQRLAIIRDATEAVEIFARTHSVTLKGCFQIFPYLCDGNLVTFINQKGQTDLGHIFLIRAVTLQDGIYKPFIMPPEPFQQLTETLMHIDGIARVCMDMTPKNGTVDKATHGATIEYE